MRTEFVAWVIVTVSLAACSSEGDILPKKERFRGQSDAGDPPDVAGDGRKPRDPDANCVKPGTPNNERGVGGYCEPGRGDCASDLGPRFCTADYAELTPIDEYKWFCSTVCSTDEECGTGWFCANSPIGKGCSTRACTPDDAGP